MNSRRLALILCLGLLVSQAVALADKPPKKSPKEALQAFNDLIGTWEATGEPEGTREEKQRGFWKESMSWTWRFKGDDAWLKAECDKGKYFVGGELHYLPEKDLFQFTVRTTAKETVTFEGKLKDRLLTLQHEDEKKKESQRLVFAFLHANRFLYRYEVKAPERAFFTRVFKVGATKQGEPFAGPGDTKPECIVSGGLGRIQVTYQGKTYYVCCSGCRDAFNDDPQKYIKEYEAKKPKEGKDRGR